MNSSKGFVPSVAFAVILFSPLLGHAINDWSTPCLHGHCAYDFSPASGSMSGTILISGPSQMISDITPAAGWSILECSETDTNIAHVIQLTCDGPEDLCNHLLQGRLENKIIRLPEDCTDHPFARIIQADWPRIHYDSPHGTNITKLGQALHIKVDFDFRRSPSPSETPISFMLIGSTLPPEIFDKIVPLPVDSKQPEDPFTDYDVTELLAELQAFAFGPFNDSISMDLPGINFDRTTLLLNRTILNADGETVTVEGSSRASVDVQVAVGIVAKGQLIPPRVTELGLFAELTGDIGGGLDLVADATGIFDSNTTLYSKALSGLDIHGILSIDPIFTIESSVLAETDFDVNVSTNISYNVENLRFTFPPTYGRSSATLFPRQASLQINSDPLFSSNATFEVHIIPSLNIGITVPRLVSTTVSLKQDVYSSLGLGFSAKASLNNSVNDQDSGLEGCATLHGGFEISVGADGSFFNIFNNDTEISILTEDAILLQRCFTEAVGSG